MNLDFELLIEHRFEVLLFLLILFLLILVIIYITHKSAQSGESVKIFCGLLEYTKKSDTSAQPNTFHVNVTKLVLLLLLCALFMSIFFYLVRPKEEPKDPGVIQINGSNTIGKSLMASLAEKYLKEKLKLIDVKNDEKEVSGLDKDKKKITIKIESSGTLTAFTCLKNKSCDIGMASYRPDSQDISSIQVGYLGDLTSKENQKYIGQDAVAIVVNEKNQVSALSIDEIRKIFLSPNPKWSELTRSSKSQEKINVYSYDINSGTYGFIKARVLGGQDIPKNGAKRFKTWEEVASNIAGDLDSIAFVSFADAKQAKGIKILSISEGESESLSPSSTTIKTGQYILSRPLYLYLTDASSSIARDLAEFAASEDAYNTIEKAGFTNNSSSIKNPTQNQNPPVNKDCFVDNYEWLKSNATRVETVVHFQSCGDQVEDVDFDQLGKTLNSFQNNIAVIGFSDDRGSHNLNSAISKLRTEAVREKLIQKGVIPDRFKLNGFGTSNFVAGNDTPDGRYSNRRVELWRCP